MASIRNATGLVALLLIAGCGAATDSASPVTGNTDASFTAVFVVRPSPVFQDYELDDDILDNINDVDSRIASLAGLYRESGITAEELNTAADKIISEYSEDPFLRIAIPQLVSVSTLNALLENEEANGLESYIAHHTQILLDNHSPHAEKISQALEVLDGYWNREEIRTAAKKAIDNAEYYLGKSNAHVAAKASEDQSSTDVPMKELQGSRAKVYAEMGSGIQNLEQLLEE